MIVSEILKKFRFLFYNEIVYIVKRFYDITTSSIILLKVALCFEYKLEKRLIVHIDLRILSFFALPRHIMEVALFCKYSPSWIIEGKSTGRE